MTEDEAKTKWCPEVRTGLVSGMAVNRHVADGPHSPNGVYHETRCIGSSCMAWRWSVQNNATGEVVQQQSRVAAEFLLKVVDFEASIGGYCGLAGKP